MELFALIYLGLFIVVLTQISGLRKTLFKLDRRIEALTAEVRNQAQQRRKQDAPRTEADARTDAHAQAEEPADAPQQSYRPGPWADASATWAAPSATASGLDETPDAPGRTAYTEATPEPIPPTFAETLAPPPSPEDDIDAEPEVPFEDALASSAAWQAWEPEEWRPVPEEEPEPALAAAAMSARPAVMPVPESALPSPPPFQAKASRPSPVDGLIRSVINFIKAGNIWVSGGVLMVLLGFGFLVSFMSERGVLSVELRIALAALGGLVMVGFGLFLRKKKPVYAMVMQGGGIGVVYLAAFAAAKLTTLLSPLAALVLMCLLMVPAVGLALIQNAQVLAIFGFLGGFAAPVLLSSGSGDYVLLFSYYTLLDIALLAICRFRLWRWLNLLGATCSFGIMGAWGFVSYEPGMFSTVEPFLIGFTLIFLAVTLMSVHKRGFSLANPPDISLALGVPLAAVTFQWTIAQELDHGLSLSALGFGAFFILLAAFIWKRWKEEARRLAEIYAAAGALLVNLAAPLEFSGAVTSGIWAAEGALTFFFGCRYDSWKVKMAGLGLQGAAMVSFLFEPALWGTENGHILLESLLLALSLLASAYWEKRHAESGRDEDGQRSRWYRQAAALAHELLPDRLSLAQGLAFAGMFWHFTGLAVECYRFTDEAGLYFFLGASISSLAFSLAGKLLRFPELFAAVAVPLCFSLVRLVIPLYFSQAALWAQDPGTPLGYLNTLFMHQYFAGLEGLSWLLFVLASAAFLALSKAPLAEKRQGTIMCVAVLELLFMLTCSFRAMTLQSLGLAPAWVSFSGLLPAFAYICAAAVLAQKNRVPKRYAPSLLYSVPAVLFLFLGGWFVFGMLDPGHPAPLPAYIPLFNPLELQQALCVALFLLWRRQLAHHTPQSTHATRLATGVALLVFIWLHSVIVRTTHHYAAVPFGPEVWDTNLFQVLLTGLWGLCGAAAIVLGHKKELRPLWIAGAALIVLDTAKLFLKDLSDKDTMFHIISFFIVGGIFLLIGLLAPLPPALKKTGAAQDAPDAEQEPAL